MDNGNSIKSKLAGFTLMELSVAIAIFGILAGLIIVNLQYGNQANRLKEAANELAQNIRMMQNYAISGKTILVCDGGSNDGKPCQDVSQCPGTPNGTCNKYAVPKGGFGIKLNRAFEVTKYTLFADVNGCKRYDSVEALPAGIIELSENKDIKIVALKIDDDATNVSVDLVFQPPLPTTFLNAGCANCYPSDPCGCNAGICGGGGSLLTQKTISGVEGKELAITLWHEKINKSKTVRVNRISGKVSVD